MQWDIDFELTRLHRLLTERLTPGCAEQTLALDEIERLTTEIHVEGRKIYVEVMKVMSRPYTDEHLRRYLEVHLDGAEYLQELLEELKARANALCLQLFDSFNEVLNRVLTRLDKLQKRHFGDWPTEKEPVPQTNKWMMPEDVMKELGISRRTLYTYEKEGLIDGRKFKGKMQYTCESVMRNK